MPNWAPGHKIENFEKINTPGLPNLQVYQISKDFDNF